MNSKNSLQLIFDDSRQEFSEDDSGKANNIILMQLKLKLTIKLKLKFYKK